MCCVVLVVEFRSKRFVGSESSGYVEVVVVILEGSSIAPIEVKINPMLQKMSEKGEEYYNFLTQCMT